VHSTHQHSQSRARSRSTSALQPTSIPYIIISLIMDNIQHLLTQQPATTKRKSGNESRRSRVTPTNSSNITTSASKATSWNPFLYRFSHHFSREAPAIIFLLHITSSLLFQASSSRSGLPIWLLASFCFGYREGELQGGVLFLSILLFHLPFFFFFLLLCYFRFPTGDLHHEINDVCVREEKECV
jgi:hypothetical protein